MSTGKMLVSVAVAVLLAVSGLAFAQGGGAMGRGGRGGFGPGGGFGPSGGLDPAQMRQVLTAAGATEADLQAIESYRTTQRSVMEPLAQATQSLREAAGESATNEQAVQVVSQYETLKASTKMALGPSLGLIDAQTARTAARTRLIQARLDWHTVARFERAMGRTIAAPEVTVKDKVKP